MPPKQGGKKPGQGGDSRQGGMTAQHRAAGGKAATRSRWIRPGAIAGSGPYPGAVVGAQPTSGHLAWQPSLFDGQTPNPDPDFATAIRHRLDPESWVEHVPGWVDGGDRLFALVLELAVWEAHTVHLYDRKVAEPRLRGRWATPLPVFDDLRALLSRRYAVEFTTIGFNLYRDGRDSVAWHGDQVARELPTATVAVLSLGEPRRFLLRPTGGGPSIAHELRSGDLLVMGGAVQRRWQHSVPKVARAGPRISVTFRHAYDQAGSPRESSARPTIRIAHLHANPPTTADSHIELGHRDRRILGLTRQCQSPPP